jgi:ATP-dependent DNA helicase Rep
MTLHAAKGLEFPHVFIVGMEENVLPHHAALAEAANGSAIEEERRLAYVGITRARQTLTLSFAETRRRAGEVVNAEPSRFLKELPAEDVCWEQTRLAPDPQDANKRATAHLDGLRALLRDGGA